MREPIADAHTNPDAYNYPDTYGDTDMDRIAITKPHDIALDTVAIHISDLRGLADDVRHTYGEPDEADRIDAIADDVWAVLNRHRKPRRRGLVRRILDR